VTDADSDLLSQCYIAMRDAMSVIDVNEGPGLKHSKILNALADARVKIERRTERQPVAAISVAAKELYGPFGWLNGCRGLSEDSWNLESDPLENSDEYFAVPLYALTDPFKEVGLSTPPLTAAMGAGSTAQPKMRFEDTFSAETVVMERFFPAIGAGGQAVADARSIAEIIDPHSFIDIPFTDDPVLLDMVEQSKKDAIRKAERILSAIAHPVQPGWRDIESAPREHGHMILAPNRYGVVDTICWNDAANDCKGGWDDGCYGDDLPPYDPEIWMPVPVLPAAPQPKGE